MIEYRPFHNTDPPKLFALWNGSELGRGAASFVSTDALETLIFAQPYFDRNGLIVACDGSQVVGCVHAGFGTTDDESKLSHAAGVICAVLVRPESRRRGIGRELVRRAEDYLKACGATSIQAGSAAPRDPFYLGLYGGAAPSGFLESDPAAAPFFEAVGYEAFQRHQIYRCDLNKQTVPISFRLMTIRRKTELRVVSQPVPLTWWWATRLGRLDTLRFLLVPKQGGESLASMTVLGLDHYLTKWQVRTIGMTELFVPEQQRRQGFGQALILAVGRRLREELVIHVECHAPTENAAAIGLLESCSFQQIDTGVVFRRIDFNLNPDAENAVAADGHSQTPPGD